MIQISSDIDLKLIRIKDHNKLVVLVKRIYPPAYKHMWRNEDCNWYVHNFYNFTNFVKELEDHNSEFYFVYFNSKICGIFKIIYNTPLPNSNYKKGLYIHRIYLGEEAQGKGVAQALFHWAECKGFADKQEIIWLEAMDTQQQSIKFYEKLNFKKTSTKRLNFDLIHKKYRGMIIYSKTLNETL